MRSSAEDDDDEADGHQQAGAGEFLCVLLVLSPSSSLIVVYRCGRLGWRGAAATANAQQVGGARAVTREKERETLATNSSPSWLVGG